MVRNAMVPIAIFFSKQTGPNQTEIECYGANLYIVK